MNEYDCWMTEQVNELVLRWVSGCMDGWRD